MRIKINLQEMLIHLILGFVLYLSVLQYNNAAIEDSRSLRTDLLTNYSKYIRPVANEDDVVRVYLGLAVIAIQEFDEVLERFSVAGAFFLYWTDISMQWDKDSYGGLSSIYMGYKEVWVPELILVNPSEKLQSYGKEWQLIKYNSGGLASWIPADLIKATCSVNVYYFPYDIQTCDLNLYTWGYSSSEVKLVPTGNTVDISQLAEHGSWKVTNTSVRTVDDDFTSKIYFTFKLKRKPQYVIVNVILPIMFLCLLNVLVFILPAASGERVSYAITVLLSIAVFMTIVSDTLPRSSEPLPLIAYFLMIDLIISALISVCTIFNLRLYHKNDNIPIPKWLDQIYLILSCNCRQNVAIDASDRGVPLMEKKARTDKVNIFQKMDNGVMEKAKEVDTSNSEDSQRKSVTWQDISIMIDYILLIIFSILTVLSFAIFMIITQNQSD